MQLRDSVENLSSPDDSGGAPGGISPRSGVLRRWLPAVLLILAALGTASIGSLPGSAGLPPRITSGTASPWRGRAVLEMRAGKPLSLGSGVPPSGSVPRGP